MIPQAGWCGERLMHEGSMIPPEPCTAASFKNNETGQYRVYLLRSISFETILILGSLASHSASGSSALHLFRLFRKKAQISYAFVLQKASKLLHHVSSHANSPVAIGSFPGSHSDYRMVHKEPTQISSPSRHLYWPSNCLKALYSAIRWCIRDRHPELQKQFPCATIKDHAILFMWTVRQPGWTKQLVHDGPATLKPVFGMVWARFWILLVLLLIP